MSEQVERKGHRGAPPWTSLGRLVLVLASVVVVVLLVKRGMALDRQLQAVLDAEARALNRGDWKAFEALQDPEDPDFHRTQKSSFDSFLSARERGEAVAQPNLHVVETSRRGDEAWVLLMEDPDGDPAVGPAKIEFFRRLYGQWLHTGPDPDHWGPPQESRTEHITWRYREPDAEQVARLAAVAETFIQQIGDDLGLDADVRTLVIDVCYSLPCGYILYGEAELELPTPLLFSYDDESLRYLLANLLAGPLVSRASGVDQDALATGSPILPAVARWEVAQVLGEEATGGEPQEVRQALADGTLLGLEDLDHAHRAGNISLVNDEAYTLVEYVVTQYGRQVLPALVQVAGRAPYYGATTAEMLQEALGADLDLDAFEAGWLSLVQERYGE